MMLAADEISLSLKKMDAKLLKEASMDEPLPPIPGSKSTMMQSAESERDLLDSKDPDHAP